jgi:sec-independent protein translocase protein TatB
MFGIGVPELLLIMGLALILLGPDKLPEMARQLARFVGELKKVSDEFKQQLELDKLEEIKDSVDIRKKVVNEIKGTTSDFLWPDDIKGHPADKELLEMERETSPAHDNTPGGLGPGWKIANVPSERSSGKMGDDLSEDMGEVVSDTASDHQKKSDMADMADKDAG